MQNKLSVDIDRPIDDVYRLTLQDVTKWSLTCVEEEILEETKGGVGTKFRIVTEEGGRRMEFMGTVTEQVEPRRSRIHLVGKAFDLDVLYTFDEIPTGTRVTQVSAAKGKGLFKVMLPVMGWMMKKSTCAAQQNELEALKTYCETGETVRGATSPE